MELSFIINKKANFFKDNNNLLIIYTLFFDTDNIRWNFYIEFSTNIILVFGALIHNEIIVINNEDGDLTIPIITSTDVANKIINSCEEDSLIGIKGKIDADEHGLIIKAERISFLGHKERAD